MRIAIDISPIIYGSGVSVYTKNIVDSLLKVDAQNEYVLFGYSLRRREEIQECLEQFRKLAVGRSLPEVKSFPIPPTLADWIWNLFSLFPIDLLIGKTDLFHSSDWVQPSSSAAKITTVHDLAFLRWPETVHPKILTAQKRRLERVKKEGVHIIVVSQATKNDVIELLNISEEKISVIYEGTPQDVLNFAVQKKPTNILKSILKKFQITKPYFLAYGSSAPRKNIGRIIQAFHKFDSGKRYQLVVFGDYKPAKALSERVILSGFLKRPELLSLFSGAEALIFASLYEGFGLPILEAFTLGVPVVTSSVSSMPEVAGKAAVLVDPYKIDSIAEGINKAIKEKDKLVDLGFEQKSKFSWEKTAKETLRIYEEIIREK